MLDKLSGIEERFKELEIKIAGATPGNIKKLIAQSGYNGGQYMKYIDDTGALVPAK